MKKKPRLKTVPDFLVRHVDRVVVDAKDILVKTDMRVAVLRYFRNDIEFSIPLNYEYFVKIGQGMRQMASATSYIQRMGPEFAFLASELAARSENKASRMEDKVSFLGHVGHVLYHVAPQAFFVIAPIHVESNDGELDRHLMNFAGQPPKPNAILVSGHNQVRSYAVINPFSTGDDGRPCYGEPKVFDSLAGQLDENALFADVYEPSRN